MKPTTKQVVSMLTKDGSVTLFTMTGEVITITNDGQYDIQKIVEYLTPKLTGTSAVDIDLVDYTILSKSIGKALDVESEGIVIVQIIDGKEVQGIFYPQKTSVQVKVDDTVVTIPDVQNLEGHMKRAAEEGSPSVVNFFKRLAPVIRDRKHSGEDLMQFIKKSEMPLTNDGRIIAYKRVNVQDDEKGIYRDCHTGKVFQQLGSRVVMPVDLVDSSRHNSCSTGLHVCNLGYLGGFSGSNTLIVLVNPEDFIAVPHGETTKARVCAYDIVGIMDAKGQLHANNGKSVKEPSFEALIADIVQGKVMQPFEIVTVTNIGKTTITPIEGAVKGTMSKGTKGKVATSGKALDEVPQAKVATNLVQKAKEAKTDAVGLTIPDDVKRVFQLLVDGVSKAEAARAAETSTRSIGRWIEKYGDPVAMAAQNKIVEAAMLSSNEAETVGQEDLEATAEMAPQIIENLTSQRADEFFAKPLTKVEQARAMFNQAKTQADIDALVAFKKAAKYSWYSLGFKDPEIKKITEFKEPAPEPLVLTKNLQVGAGSVAQQAQAFFGIWLKAGTANNLKNLLDFKKAKKKSWEALGFTETDIGRIEKAAKR